MRVTVSEEQVFIPEWGDNKKCDKPIRIVVRTPTVAERVRVVGYTPVVIGGETQIQVKMDPVGLASQFVKSVENLQVQYHPGDVRDITDAEQLINAQGLHALVEEIGNFVYGLHASPLAENSNAA
jgi:hypothetical protein